MDYEAITKVLHSLQAKVYWRNNASLCVDVSDVSHQTDRTRRVNLACDFGHLNLLGNQRTWNSYEIQYYFRSNFFLNFPGEKNYFKYSRTSSYDHLSGSLTFSPMVLSALHPLSNVSLMLLPRMIDKLQAMNLTLSFNALLGLKHS